MWNIRNGNILNLNFELCQHFLKTESRNSIGKNKKDSLRLSKEEVSISKDTWVASIAELRVLFFVWVQFNAIVWKPIIW